MSHKRRFFLPVAAPTNDTEKFNLYNSISSNIKKSSDGSSKNYYKENVYIKPLTSNHI